MRFFYELIFCQEESIFPEPKMNNFHRNGFPFSQGFDGKDGARGDSGAPGPKVKICSVIFVIGGAIPSIIFYIAMLCILCNYKNPLNIKETH